MFKKFYMYVYKMSKQEVSLSLLNVQANHDMDHCPGSDELLFYVMRSTWTNVRTQLSVNDIKTIQEDLSEFGYSEKAGLLPEEVWKKYIEDDIREMDDVRKDKWKFCAIPSLLITQLTKE